MTDLVMIMIIVFSLLLAVLLAVLFFHPRFPEREQPPSLLNRGGNDPQPEMTYDHNQLFPLLKRQYTDLEVFMDAEVMKEGILLHWRDAHASDERILLDVTQEGCADTVLHVLQRMKWRQAGCAFDLYVLIRKDSQAQRESERYLSRLITEKIGGLSAMLKETDGLLQINDYIFALVSEERWPSIDFETECDEEMCQNIIARYKKEAVWKKDRTDAWKKLKKQLPQDLAQKIGSSPEKAAQSLPFAEVFFRPSVQLIRNGKNILRLTAKNDAELEEGITVLAGIFRKTDLDYGIARQNRSAQLMKEGSPFAAKIHQALTKTEGVIPVSYGGVLTEGWPGIDTVGFAPRFREGETAKELSQGFYQALLENNTAEQN